MKTFTLTAATLLALTVNLTAAKWRVNNLPGTDAHFTTLQAAHNASYVNAGDTIYLEASAGSYGNLTATKRLVIIGTGYFLNQNANTQANQASSTVENIVFNSGSGGSILSGCTIEGTIKIKASNLVIERNFICCPINSTNISILFDAPTNNTIIRNNYIRPYSAPTTSYSTALIQTDAASNNVIIKGNYLETRSTNSWIYAINVSSNFSGEISNNVIDGRVSISNATFNNNIQVSGAFSYSSSFVNNNIGNSTQFGTINGNQQNVDMASVFLNTGSADGRWQLKEGSPAIGAGVGGVDCGMYGGDFPYKLSGLPAVPAIYFHEQTLDNNNQQLNVTIKAKSHN